MPEKKVIQQIMTDHRRSGLRGTQPFEAVDAMGRQYLREPLHSWGSRCIYYRRPGLAAHQRVIVASIIFSYTGCLDDAADYGYNDHGADGTHKVVEDDLITDVVVVQRLLRRSVATSC